MTIESDMKASAQSIHQRLMKPAPQMPKAPTIIRRTVMVDRRKPPEVVPFAHIETPRVRQRMKKADLDKIFEEDVTDGREWREGVKGIMHRYGETLDRLRTARRDKNLVDCRRQITIFLRARGWSYSRIGEFMQKDHSSIVQLVNPKRQYPAMW